MEQETRDERNVRIAGYNQTYHERVVEAIEKSRSAIEDIVHPDVETHINEKGGKQSRVPVRFDLIDAKAIFSMAKVLHEGAEKYGAENWRNIDVNSHLNHLIMHAYAYLAGDRTDEHLSHIMCRATFAQGVALQTETEESSEPTPTYPVVMYDVGPGTPIDTDNLPQVFAEGKDIVISTDIGYVVVRAGKRNDEME